MRRFHFKEYNHVWYTHSFFIRHIAPLWMNMHVSISYMYQAGLRYQQVYEI